MELNACWITLNRACNLRCSFCYTNRLGFKKDFDMKYDDYLKIIDFCKQANIHSVTLIGGEPTVYPYFFKCVEELVKNNIDFVVVTNGVLFSDDDYLKKAIDSGLDKAGVVSLSVKDVDEKWYKTTTGVAAYNKTLKAYKNLKKNNIRTAFSFVVTPENVDRYLKCIEDFYDESDSHFVGISICYDFNETKNKDPYHLEKMNYPLFLHHFVQTVPELERITGGHWNLQCGVPRCLIAQNDLKVIGKHTYVGCQLIDGWGIVFDSDLSMIPCNSSFGIRLGKLGVDFSNFDEFIKYCEEKNYKETMKYLRSLPSSECLDCKLLTSCKGGCNAYWSQFGFEDLKEYLKNYDFNSYSYKR